MEGTAEDLAVVWRDDVWRTEVEGWIRSVLSGAEIAAVGPPEQVRLKPWSTHLVVATDRGRYWFKENCPALRFEASLVETLSQLVPRWVPEPVAIDVDHGRTLTPDGGATLDQAGATADVFQRTLEGFGTLQQALASHGDEVVRTGLPVLPTKRAADHVERQLRDLQRLPAGHPLHVDQDVMARTAVARGIVERAARHRGDPVTGLPAAQRPPAE